jgi:cyclic pyranopterin phosphate synthase
MPADGVPKLRHQDVLSYEDLYRIACESVALGIEKIRITGGEPLVRHGLIDFLAQTSKIDGLQELVVTTNGVLLRSMAADLRRAGVQRLNISLDSLKPEIFAKITRGGHLHTVLDGIAAAEEAGFPPVKINVVVMRGVNDAEVLDFAALTIEKPYTVRFIEYMPTTGEDGWQSVCVTAGEVLQRIESRYKLSPLVGNHMSGPARNFKIDGAAGAIGVVSPISNHFCDFCNRIRVTAAGDARSCLFASEGVDLKPYLRGAEDGRLREVLRQLVASKPGHHDISLTSDESKQQLFQKFSMSQIGG